MNYLKLELGDKIIGKYQGETKSNYFYINSSFEINEIKLNDVKYTFNSKIIGKYKKVLINNDDDLFKYKDKIQISILYNGILDGTTGLYPYVREKTSDDFYILRSETVYFPVFFEPGSNELIERFINPTNEDEFTVEVISNKDIKTNLIKQASNVNVYSGYNPTICVSNYRDFKFNFGIISLLLIENLESINKSFEEKVNHIVNMVEITNKYMNNYKKATINNFKVIEIKKKYGSFILKNSMFIEEDTILNIPNIVHELIHTNWNPNVKIEDQRCRFFDEGLTQYFTYRVVEDNNLLEKGTMINSFNDIVNKYIKYYNGNLPSIREFGIKSLGGLSYGIGPLFLIELEKLIGKSTLDIVLKKMLKMYEREKIDFDKFLELVISQGKAIEKEIILLFNEYIFSNLWINKFNSN